RSVERPRRRRRQDRLQLLRGAAQRPCRRPGAHLESRRRAALRALFPSDLALAALAVHHGAAAERHDLAADEHVDAIRLDRVAAGAKSEEHTSELQSLAY